MDDSYRDRLAALVNDKGEAIPLAMHRTPDEAGQPGEISHHEAVRLIVLEYHESKKASVDEDDGEETPNGQSPAVDPPAAGDDAGSGDT